MIVRRFEIEHDAANQDLFIRAIDRFGVATPAVPMIIIGDRVLVGYRDDATTGRTIFDLAQGCLSAACSDPMRALISGERQADAQATEGSPLPETIRLPLIGEIPTASLSLPVLTVVLAALDGFNPCAMWVLVFLIGLLLGLKDRARMWLLGGTFLLASAAVYFLFLAAWLNVLLILGAFAWLRVAVGLVAVGGGLYHLREYARGAEAVCEVTAPERRRRVFDRLKQTVQRRNLGLALIGVALLAVAVNVVELLCSAGLPAVYTAVLAQTPLPSWHYYLYLGLYVTVFLADDLIVFAAAMVTLQLTVGASYSRYARLVGGAVLLTIGALLILRPDWLMFGTP
jgi:hypothetical protein